MNYLIIVGFWFLIWAGLMVSYSNVKKDETIENLRKWAIKSKKTYNRMYSKLERRDKRIKNLLKNK